ncbi:MAG: SdrD B-like domain-containing protein [Candidatus Limiplasma sp.]|nr:SdrD B-like domain-containing protein [Candidatus Limiplasma sp.]
MSFTENPKRQPKASRGGGLFFISLALCLGLLFSLALGSAAWAGGGQTTLTVSLKGLSTDDGVTWRSLSINGLFEVQTLEGRALGMVRANPTQEQREAGESDTLVIEDPSIQSLRLVPVQEGFSPGFICRDSVQADLAAGEGNPVTAVAYAAQGLFTLENTLEGSGAPAPQAEYMVLDSQGNMRASFVTDEEGRYLARQALPVGQYQLVQMRSSQGTLPDQQPQPFSISTFFGDPAEITQLRVVSRPVPDAQGQAEIRTLSAQPLAQERDSDTDTYFSSVSLSPVIAENTSLSLSELKVTLMPAALLDGQGQRLEPQGALAVESVALSGVSEGYGALVQGLDEAGRPVGEVKAATSGSLAVLDSGSVGAQVTYVNLATGEAVVESGFQAGQIDAAVLYYPFAGAAEGASASGALLSAQIGYACRYYAPDGNSLLSAEGGSAPQEIALQILDGRAALSLRASTRQNDQGQQELVVELERFAGELREEIMLAAYLTPGARVEAARLEGLLLRTQEQDIVAFSLKRLEEGVVVIPIGAGVLDSLQVWGYDPSTLARTAVNPGGACIVAEAHEAAPLLDALFSKVQGQYAALPCAFSGGIALPGAEPCDQLLVSGALYEDTDQNGSRSQEEQALAQHGVLLRGEQSNVYYGALTDGDGAFSLYAQAGGPDRAGILHTMLPLGAVSAGAGATGVLESRVDAFPSQGHMLRYEMRGAIRGKALLDGRAPLAGLPLTLFGEGQTLASTVTDAAGAYGFQGLSAGAYQVTAQLLPELSAGWIREEGLSLEGDKASFEVALAYGQQAERDVNAVSLGGVTGVLTQEGQPVQGLGVRLVSAGGGTLEQSTDGQGAFAFGPLSQGEYTLGLELPQGVAVIRVNGEQARGLPPYEAPLVLGPGEELRTEIELGRTATLTGQIPGVGQDQTVVAASMTDQVSAVTDAQGRFTLQGIVPGDYTLYAPLAQGKTLAENGPWQVTQKGDMVWMSLTVAPGENRELPGMELAELTGIQGVAYVDENGDYAYSPGEQLMSGVGVALQKKAGEGWEDIAGSQTDEYGAYGFAHLEEGVYRVASMARSEDLCVVAVGAQPRPLGSGGVMVSGELSLSRGMALKGEADIALGKPASLRFAAFADSNENGTRGEYERPIPGVTVEVISGDEAVMASGVTDGAGEAMVTGIFPGNASLRITLPHGYRYTVQGEGEGLGVSCAASEDSVAQSAPMAFSSGQTTEAGIAAVPVGSFSGKVWMDENNNGIMDPQEPGVSGITLSLTGNKTGKAYTVLSGEDGGYLFDRLPNDAYRLAVELPQGLLFARYSETGGDLRSVFTVAGSKASREFPLTGAGDITNKNVGVIPQGSIQGTAFLDLNYNGVWDEGEPGYPGVMLEAYRTVKTEPEGKTVTQEDGSFALGGLRAGDYRLRAVLPDDGSIFTLVSPEKGGQANGFAQRQGRRESSVSPITIGTGGTATTVVGVARGAVIKGTVFQDDDYDGLMKGKGKKHSGIKVELRDEAGALVSGTFTNANGNYTLDGVMPGRYTIAFLRKDGHAFSRLRPDQEGGNWVKGLEGEFGLTQVIEVSMGQSIEDVNAGMLRSSTLAGVFFDDLNDNGIQDEGEAGMEDVIVRLYSPDAEIDLTAPVQAEGGYFFDGVMPGKYTLQYLLPENVEMAITAQGGNTLQGPVSEEFTVESGAQILRPLVGGVRLGTFTGYLFHDVNANGVQDEGEQRAGGLAVTLTPSRTDLEVSRTEADGEGNFAIAGLRPADYQLGLKLPEGYIFSSDIKATGLRLDTALEQKMNCPWQVLVSRQQNAIGMVKPATLKGYVWLDENRDGVQSSQEALLPGLAFELVDEAQGRVVKTAVSAQDGYAVFANVRPGGYTVRFAMPAQSEPAGEAEATLKLQGGMMAQGGIQMAEGQVFEEIHAGLVSRTSIGGMVVLEEAGQRRGLGGVAVALYMEGGDQPVQTALTQEDGTYRFDGLWPGAYFLVCEWPENMIFVAPSDPNYQEGVSVIVNTEGRQGRSAVFELKMARSQLAQNIVLIRPAKVGDLAWLDLNQNGLLDAGEPAVPGITVQLLSQGQVVAETVTNAYGYYLFEGVYPGQYVLQAKGYPQLGITTPVPELRLISSCLTRGDGNEARSDAFEVVSGSVNLDFDLGFVLKEGQEIPGAIITPPPQKDWTGSYVSGGRQ